jgi:hypothetical protein
VTTKSLHELANSVLASVEPYDVESAEIGHRPHVTDLDDDLLAISPRTCGMTTAQARSVGGLAEPAVEVAVGA